MSEDINIWMTVPSTYFDIRSVDVTKQVIRGNKTVTEVVGSNKEATLGKVQRYTGGEAFFGSRVTYAENDLQAKIFNYTFVGG